MKPKKTVDWLIDAQQKAIELFECYRSISEKDVYELLGLNPALAAVRGGLPDHGERVTYGGIIRYVSSIAHNYYDIDSYAFEYRHDPERVIKPGEFVFETKKDITEEFREKSELNEVVNDASNYYHHALNRLNVGKENNSMPTEGLRHYRSIISQGIIQKAEKELTDILLEKGFFTAQDVHNALGINKPADDKRKLVEFDVFDRLAMPERVKNEIIRNVDDAFSSVYQPYEDLPCTLYPVRMWTTPNGYTTVEWEDGTKTTAKAENEANATEYGGFCACVVKKLYGSTSNGIYYMNRSINNVAWPAKKKQIERDKMKKLHADKIEAEKKYREKVIRNKMDDIRLEREAERRLAQQKDGEE